MPADCADCLQNPAVPMQMTSARWRSPRRPPASAAFKVSRRSSAQNWGLAPRRAHASTKWAKPIRSPPARDEGYACVTLHVGSGFEDDATMLAVCEDIVKASQRHAIPLYVETHRATITTDIWRTIQLARRLPELRFNGDFSHWYTGHEMVYGDLAAKLEMIGPVFERVRFIHGRIGNPGCMQVDIGDGTGRTYVDHFKEMWTRSLVGFLKSAKPGDYICFTPELLPPNIYYARVFKNAQGELREECDRWQQALLYCEIAKNCFEAAKQRIKTHP